MKKTGLRLEEFTADQLLTLMNIYLSEWCHRSDMLWNHVFKYFYATLVAIFLPNIASFLGINLPNFPAILFPVLAFILTGVFLFVSLQFAVRLEINLITYRRIIDLLPQELRKASNLPMTSWEILRKSFTIIIYGVIFSSLFAMSTVMIVYYLTVEG